MQDNMFSINTKLISNDRRDIIKTNCSRSRVTINGSSHADCKNYTTFSRLQITCFSTTCNVTANWKPMSYWLELELFCCIHILPQLKMGSTPENCVYNTKFASWKCSYPALFLNNTGQRATDTLTRIFHSTNQILPRTKFSHGRRCLQPANPSLGCS